MTSAGAASAAVDVPTPRPRRAPRIACRLELRVTLGLDPEARAGSVGRARVVHPAPAAAQPPALEQGADHVPAVAHDVHEARLGEGLGERGRDERGLRRLLDGAEVPDEGEASGRREDAPDLRGGVRRRQTGELAAAPP